MILTKPELVSAIIPTHNRPDLVEKAVLSALHQTHTSMEVIVVIDGVDRATEEALARIHDTRLRIIALALNAGGSEARNIGIRAAEGKWVAFLDDDDEWLPHKITKQIEAAVASKLAFPVISSRMVVRTPLQDFTVPRRLFAADEAMSEYLFYRRDLTDGPFTLQTSTLFMRRETMLSIPFRIGLKRHQDWDWLLRASKHPGVNFHMIAEPLTIFRAGDARTSVSRTLDWEYSFHWAREMSSYFTPRSYSFFLATECLSRALKSQAGTSVYARLGREFIVRGRPTLRSIAWLAAFVCVPERLRIRMRNLLRKRSVRLKGIEIQQASSGVLRPISLPQAANHS